jgi:NCS1 family nucleobase:cation symporter-1
MRGGFWPVLNRIMTACIWVRTAPFPHQSWSNTNIFQMGIQTYWGGQAVRIVLSAVIGPKYAYMTNTLPLSANVDTCSLVSFFIFLVIICPMLLIPPEKLQMPLRVSCDSSVYLLMLSKPNGCADCICHDRL